MTKRCSPVLSNDHAIGAVDKGRAEVNSLLESIVRHAGSNDNAEGSLLDSFRTCTYAGEDGPEWTCESDTCKLQSEPIVNSFGRVRCRVCHCRRKTTDRESAEERVRMAGARRAVEALSGSRLKAQRSLVPLVELLIGLGVGTYYVTCYRPTRSNKGKVRCVHHYRTENRWQHFNSTVNVVLFVLEHSDDDGFRSQLKKAVSVAVGEMGEHLCVRKKLEQALERLECTK